MIATAPDADWRALKAASRIPLAGAENLRGHDRIDSALGWLDFIQPDVGKWGGATDCFTIAQKAIAAGKTYCPHWLGGGIGLMHSAQLLTAARGEGLLEVDVNENPLRDHILGQALPVVDGHIQLPRGQGIGPEPDLAALQRWGVDHATFE
jgi:L-alanine-DL-glutamate epimerase-like enolase superfamily enzyme